LRFDWFPNRIPTEISRLRWIPDLGPPEALLLRELPSPILARRLESAGRLKKVGSACASRFFLDCPFQCFGKRSFLRMSAASAVVEAMRTAPFPEGRSPATKVPCGSAFRVAPRGIFAQGPVDHVNPVDKFPIALKRGWLGLNESRLRTGSGDQSCAGNVPCFSRLKAFH
jgi:hypothetical protein